MCLRSSFENTPSKAAIIPSDVEMSIPLLQ
jgi:hypothetical protein